PSWGWSFSASSFRCGRDAYTEGAVGSPRQPPSTRRFLVGAGLLRLPRNLRDVVLSGSTRAANEARGIPHCLPVFKTELNPTPTVPGVVSTLVSATGTGEDPVHFHCTALQHQE